MLFGVADRIKKSLCTKRISELRRAIQKNMLRRLKKDKLKELPEIVFKIIPLGMSAKQRKLYDAVKKEIIEDLKDTSLKKVPSALAKLLRLQQITNSPALIGADEVESSKLQALDELLEKIIDESNQKVIVFSRFRTMTEILKERYKKYNPAVIHGDVDANGKTENAAVKAAIRKLVKKRGWHFQRKRSVNSQKNICLLIDKKKFINSSRTILVSCL